MDKIKSPSIYPIGVVEERTGLTARQIRYYEKMGLMSPERTKGKQRRYSESDINLLLRIKRHIKEGLDIRQIKEKLSLTGSGEQALGQDPKLTHRPRKIELITDISSIYPMSNRAKILELIDIKKRG